MSIASQVETNIKDRVSAVSKITDNATRTGRAAVDHLTKLEPVQGIFTVTEGVFDGLSRFFKEQAAITRRWIKR